MTNATYLGDGVYVTVDGIYEIMLTTGDHREELADNKVFMEPRQVQSLIEFLHDAGITFKLPQ